jgi:choline dehydrogenase-like flavoprotein
MLVDSCKLPRDEVIETEVCIVGAGPAGITLAREFIGQKFRVCLLESGELNFNRKTRSLSECENIGYPPFLGLKDMRHRQYGGQANLWNIQINDQQIGLRHVPLDEIDFEKRDWVPYSGWPFSKSHLNPFYERAQSICKLGIFAYEAEAWEDLESPRVCFRGDKLTTTMFQFGPSDIFTKEYRYEINQSPNITTYINANVVELETDETAKTVTRVRVACLSGNKFWVAAKIFILAAGAIENARLLLMSNQNQKAGLGNHNDVVGRFFMDHPLIRCGMLFPKSRKIFNSMALYDLRQVNNCSVMGKFSLTQQVMRQEKLLNMSALLFPRDENFQFSGNEKAKSETIASVKILVSVLKYKKIQKKVLWHLGNAIANINHLLSFGYENYFNRKQQYLFPNLSQGGWSYNKDNEQKYVKFEVLSQTEQVPNPNNRVTLSDIKDRLGYPQPRLTFYWNDINTDSIKRTQKIFAEEFANAGLGKLQIEPLEGNVKISTHHNMGTTRMHLDPKQGVVDENCQVHNVSNLFIAGSSVFPTGGYANPTLTIIALAVRLADRVKTLFS